MRWHLNSALPKSAADLKAHLDERAAAFIKSFEQHEQPLTTQQRTELTAQAALMKPEMTAAVSAACDLARAHGKEGCGFMVSASAHTNVDGTRSFAVFVDVIPPEEDK